MNRTYDTSAVQATYESPEIDFSLVSKRSENPSHDPATNENSDGCEQGFEKPELSKPWPSNSDELLEIEHWKPTEPQFCKAIAEHYQQGKRTIQKWFVDLREIAPWLAESELRLSDDRYTPLAVELLGDRYFAGSKKKWAQVLMERFGDRAAVNVPSLEAPAIRPEVLPREAQPASLERTAASSLVPTGVNYLTALEEEEAELQALEAQEIELLNRMHQSDTRLNQNQAQWDRTADLRRQRLLRQTRLEAAALATELEAEFENTLRETQYQIQRGNVPAPGKPQAQNPPRSQPNPPDTGLNPSALGDRSIAANTATSTPHWLNSMERFTSTETLAFQNLALNTAVEEVERAAVSCEIAGFATSITAQENQLAFIRYQQARIALASKILRSPTP